MKRCFLIMLVGFCAVDSVASRPLEAIEDSDFYFDGAVDPAKFELGRSLFFDKILSINKNIACSTCHHPSHGTSDDLALPHGEGARGLGPKRRVGAEQPVSRRVPRKSQALYMLGAREFDSLFHDGRVEPDPQHTWPSGFWSPAREQLPAGLDNTLAAQAMFPVTSPVEMAGHKGENPVATAVANDLLGGPEGVWALLARRLQAIPDYVALFRAAFLDIEHAQDIAFGHAANAIAAFEASAFRADESPFDRYLRTNDKHAMNLRARRGMDFFYGRGGCTTCHSGKFLTDQQFHAIAMPQVDGKTTKRARRYGRGGVFACADRSARRRSTVPGPRRRAQWAGGRRLIR
jgi:cytochrome c peroxidase